MQIKVIQSVSGMWLVGRTEGNDHVKMPIVHDPVLIRYTKNISINGVGIEMDHIDPVVRPKELRITPAVMYDVNETVREKYQSFLEKNRGKEIDI